MKARGKILGAAYVKRAVARVRPHTRAFQEPMQQAIYCGVPTANTALHRLHAIIYRLISQRGEDQGRQVTGCAA